MVVLVLEIIKFLVLLLASLVVVSGAFTLLGSVKARLSGAIISTGIVLVIYGFTARTPVWFIELLWLIYMLKVVVLLIPSLRQTIITGPMLRYFRRVLPEMSDTEREALEAGTVWWESEIFSGRPDWKKLVDAPAPVLTEEEQAFIDGPVETLCEMIDDWKVTAEDFDLSKDVWDYIREQGFSA